jgi:hypothetical protein
VGTPPKGEAGQGLISTVFGFAAVLLMLLFAVQAIFDLYARSVVTTAAVRAARSAAAFPATPRDEAIAQAEASLGGYAGQVHFTWMPAPPGQLWLRADFDLAHSSFDLSRWALPFLNSFDRTVKVRVEQLVCPTGGCTTVGGT